MKISVLDRASAFVYSWVIFIVSPVRLHCSKAQQIYLCAVVRPGQRGLSSMEASFQAQRPSDDHALDASRAPRASLAGLHSGERSGGLCKGLPVLGTTHCCIGILGSSNPTGAWQSTT